MQQQQQQPKENDNQAESKPTWKKRSVGSRQVRTRAASVGMFVKKKGSDNDANVCTDETDVLSRLSSVRETQALRASFKRRGGIQADSEDNDGGFLPESKRLKGGDESERSSTSDGKYLAGLNSSHAARAGDITDHTSRMEKYIQEKIDEYQESRREQEIRELKIRQGASLDDDVGGKRLNACKSGQVASSSNEDTSKYESYEAKQKKLFEIPDEYKAESKLIKDSQNKIAWITGISEVELPLSYKLKNIQETEEAKKKLLSNPVVFKSTDRKLYRFTNVLDKDKDKDKDKSFSTQPSSFSSKEYSYNN